MCIYSIYLSILRICLFQLVKKYFKMGNKEPMISLLERDQLEKQQIKMIKTLLELIKHMEPHQIFFFYHQTNHGVRVKVPSLLFLEFPSGTNKDTEN